MTKTVTAILLGAGLRGANAYSSYALNYPNEFKVVAVAEPDALRRENFAQAHHIAPENVFDSWEKALAQPKLADCAMVCMQDRMHAQPAVRALGMGYHVLCEKPMSPFKEEILAMSHAAEQSGKILAICHVLRYAPFFMELKRLISSGAIGQLICIQHMESVGYYHAAHSYVRGNWRSSTETSPMVLAKCCHDMDILRWLVDAPCEAISSFGDRSYFRAENAPKDAPDYCLDGCPHRDACPYYAPRFYLRHELRISDGFDQAVTEDMSNAGILNALAHGPYGRCVFHCDNDVVDNQVINLRFASGVTVSMTMCAFTEKCERTISVMGSQGQIQGNMDTGILLLRDFATSKHTEMTFPVVKGGHNGSDERMMREFVALIAKDGQGDYKTTASGAVESHLMALAAEDARVSGQTVFLGKEGKL